MEKIVTEHSSPRRDYELSQVGRVIESRKLFGESREVTIQHDGALYRLKITKQGKLILNK